MEELGYKYTYLGGRYDSDNPLCVTISEERIIYEGEKYSLQFNLWSKAMVLVMHEDNAEYYGNRPTFFITKELMECIDEITKNLGWTD